VPTNTTEKQKEVLKEFGKGVCEREREKKRGRESLCEHLKLYLPTNTSEKQKEVVKEFGKGACV